MSTSTRSDDSQVPFTCLEALLLMKTALSSKNVLSDTCAALQKVVAGARYDK